METCKDCIHDEICDMPIITDGRKNASNCKKFKNKSDFVEVVRCAECLHYDFQHHQCDNPLGLWSTYMDKFCCYGERKDA